MFPNVDVFSTDDLHELSALVATAWRAGTDRERVRRSGGGVRAAADLCRRLREHTRRWALWTFAWDGLPCTEDPWGDLLTGSGRHRRDAAGSSTGSPRTPAPAMGYPPMG